MITLLDTTPLMQCGISQIRDLYAQSNLKTLGELEEEFNLPKPAMFTGVCILHFLTKHPIPTFVTQPKVWYYTYIGKQTKGISLLL